MSPWLWWPWSRELLWWLEVKAWKVCRVLSQPTRVALESPCGEVVRAWCPKGSLNLFPIGMNRLQIDLIMEMNLTYHNYFPLRLFRPLIPMLIF